MTASNLATAISPKRIRECPLGSLGSSISSVDCGVANVGDIPGLIAALADGTVDDFLSERRQSLETDDWKRFVEAAAEAHRRGELDLSRLLAGDSDRRLRFGTQQLVELVVPQAELSLTQLLTLTQDAVARSKDSGTPYWMQNAVAAWAVLEPARSAALIRAIDEGSAPPDLRYTVMMAWFEADRAIGLAASLHALEHGVQPVRDVNAAALGRYTAFDAGERQKITAALRLRMQHAGEVDAAAPLRALLNIALRHRDALAAGRAALTEVAPRVGRHMREAIALELMFQTKSASPDLVRPALQILADTKVDEISAIEGIDQIAAENVDGLFATATGELVDHLLVTGSVLLKQLDSFSHKLLTQGGSALSATVLRWLIADELALYRGIRDLCNEVGGEPITFDLDFNSACLSTEKAIRIGRRSCGVLLIHPETAASILVSLMKTGPDGAMTELTNLLFDPLLLSYWTGVGGYLETILPTAPAAVREAIDSVLERLAEHRVAIERAGAIPELRPSSRQRYLVAVKRHEEHRAIGKKAMENSILAAIAPMQQMMFGDSAIFDMEVEPGKSIRQEAPLSTHEHSRELPRLDIIDPFGTWYRRSHLIRGQE